MKGSDGKVNMAGEIMEVTVSAGCLAECRPPVASQLPCILSRLCETLSLRAVSRYFIRDIRIGETVALVDKAAGYAFRLRMDASAVCVLGIYENQLPPKDTPVVYLINTHLLRSVIGKAVAA